MKPLLLFFFFVLSACNINSSAKSESALKEGACDETQKTFSVAGAARTGLLITQLPRGDYRHTNVEIYIESKIVQADGSTNLSRVQFLETPVPNTNPAGFSNAVRCRETSGRFSPYFTQVALVTDFVSYGPDQNRFDISSHSYPIFFQTELSPNMQIAFAGEQRSINSGTVAYTISSNWNSGYQFIWRGGDVYEFHGARSEAVGGKTIYGKAVYTRANLPASF